jgi:5-(aminomethyl)-3-furanmethanol phosphate kinase
MTRELAADLTKAAPSGILRVVKLGGSLLSLDDWPRRLVGWIAREAPARTVLIVGGGKLADCVRDYDRRFALGEETSHWLCIRALSLHAEMAAKLLSRERMSVSLKCDFAELPQIGIGTLAVFDPEPFLRTQESALPGIKLPHSWDATTDSIAARIADCLDADELVLIKVDLPGEQTSSGVSYVDRHFSDASRNLRSVLVLTLDSRT